MSSAQISLARFDAFVCSVKDKAQSLYYHITVWWAEYNKYIAGVDWPFIKITDCQQLPIEIYSKFVLPNSLIIGRMLKMPVTDIQVRDFGMMGQAQCTVGLMCMAKCLQSITALQTIPTKISYFHSNIFIDYWSILCKIWYL